MMHARTLQTRQLLPVAARRSKLVGDLIIRSYVCNRLKSSLLAPPLVRRTQFTPPQLCQAYVTAAAPATAVPTRNPNLQLADTEVKLVVNSDYQPDDELIGPRPDWWWTGLKPPSDGSPVTSLPSINLHNYTRESLFEAFANQWLLTEVLFASLQGERAFTVPQYHNLRHPLIFYLAHPAVIFMMKLRVAGVLPLLDDPQQIAFEQLFETGVDEMSWDDMSKNEKPWPSVRSVVEYRKECFDQIKELIMTSDLIDGRPITQDSPLWALAMGIAHEAIHLETSSVLMRETPLKYLKTPTGWPAPHPSVLQESAHPPQAGVDYPVNPTVDVAATTVELGKPKDYPSYGWDNEYGSATFDVPAFRAKAMLTSNGEFHEFVVAGGYRERKYWSDAGWEWRRFRNAKWPTWWVAYGPAGAQRFKLRTLFSVVDMPWSWPAEVNMYESEAFANWRSERDGVRYALPSEVQHNVMRDAATPEKRAEGDLGLTLGSTEMAKVRNTNLAFGSGSPVDAYAPTATGFYDTHGNVYEYASDELRGLPGFQVHPYYEDFTLPCIDGKHFVIMGGSFVSTDNLTSPFSRYHFRKHFFQHCGFRLTELSEQEQAARDAEHEALAEAEGHHKYETDAQLKEYFALHFGTPSVQLPVAVFQGDLAKSLQSFPQRCARALSAATINQGSGTGRALDVGCSIGGSTFELTKTYDEVIGLDFSASFIDVANVLRENGSYTYRLKESGDRETRELLAKVCDDANLERVSFEVGDACQLRSDIGQFDAVLGANLLCRLPEPRKFLDALPGLVADGGVVMFTSPFSWFTEYTPREHWLGGTNEMSSEEAVRTEMEARGFELIEMREMPFMMREHKRKFQFIVPHATIFRKK